MILLKNHEQVMGMPLTSLKQFIKKSGTNWTSHEQVDF